ncbi:DUF445 domain-containing protein [Peribacillus saganii]|uniref:DUF445 domain-containing protein n=1 Tax=Peribacillus saganii TaxID=2303992 RepID=A0A372LM63_9BACI|nr:DUF445 domain-containing protein [Peribacillus saganii]RFU67592.1 DUF445 domain-containing protein [Peribacillus saganii]
MSKNSRHLASISLAIMGTGFLATIPFQGSLPMGLLHGGFEAGLVGGLADWFAVTALFRHPLGIPIPHTALLPKNRSRVTKALVSTLENDWLSKESIQEKISKIKITEKLVPVLEKQLHSPALKEGMKSLFRELILLVNTEKLVPFIEKELKANLSLIKIRPIGEMIVKQALERKYEEKAFDFALEKVDEWVNKDTQKYELGRIAIKALDNIELDGILQFAMKSFRSMINEDKLGSILQRLLSNAINGLREPDSVNREELLNQLRNQLSALPGNNDVIDELENLKETLIEQWNPVEKITETLQKYQQKLLIMVQEDKFLDEYILPGITRLSKKLKEDESTLNKIEDFIQKQIASLISENHSKIGNLVKENLDKLDTDSLIEMMENNIGKDLQWIRVNGAVCGFLIGIILTGFKAVF